MERKEVYAAIDTERDYVDNKEQNDPTSHIVENFPLGSALSAIRHNLAKAEALWYQEVQPDHEGSMDILRKIAGICVKMGENYGMPKRKS